MACGDRFRYLVVTASGLNLENPYDDVPLFSDYEEWRELARRLGVLSQTYKDALGAAEEPAVALWNDANEVHSRMVEKYDALPSFLSTDVAVDIAAAQSAIFDALCVIEMSEDGIVSLGGTPPPAPGAPPPRENDGIIPKIPPWLLPVGIGVAALYLFARSRR
jgi:hypothetical protein